MSCEKKNNLILTLIILNNQGTIADPGCIQQIIDKYNLISKK